MAVKDLLRGLLPAGVAALALAALVGAAPRALPVTQAYPRGPLKDVVFPSPLKDFNFQRIRQGDRWDISYRFHGVSKDHQVSCSIGIAQAEKLIAQFSYRNSDKASAMLAAIQERVREDGPPVGSYGMPAFSTKFDEAKDVIVEFRWKTKPESILTMPDQQNAEAEELKFRQWYEPRKESLRAEAESQFMVRHGGFIHDPRQGWLLDYAELVKQATPVLNGCIEAFSQEVGKSPELLMSFFQEMPFALIQDDGTGSTTGGVRVPPSLLLQNEGDCDSKALTFCVLHRRYSNGLVLFRTFRKKGNRTPGHVLVGIELYSSSSKWGKEWPRVTLEAGYHGDPILVNNHYLVPCEVSGGHGRVAYSTVALRHDEAGTPISKDDYVVISIPGSP